MCTSLFWCIFEPRNELRKFTIMKTFTKSCLLKFYFGNLNFYRNILELIKQDGNGIENIEAAVDYAWVYWINNDESEYLLNRL